MIELKRPNPKPTRWVAFAFLVFGVALGTALNASPVAAHVGSTVSHVWTKHIRPLSDARYANTVPGTDKAKDADQLDGKDSSAFYATGTKVPEATHADDAATLGGEEPAAYLPLFAIIRHAIVTCPVAPECPPSGDKIAPVVSANRGVLEAYDEKATSVATNDVTIRFDRDVSRCAISATATTGPGSHGSNHYVTTKDDWMGGRGAYYRVLIWNADGSPAPIEGGSATDLDFVISAIC